MNFSLNKFLFSTLVVFSIGCVIRAVPTYINYPYPIGYDSINYYLPFLYNFSNNGINWTTSYPVYLFIVSFFSKLFLIDPYTFFNFINITLYGLFGVSIQLVFTRLMKISLLQSILFSIFVLVQLCALRMSWDLYRDLLSMIFLNLCLLLINTISKNFKSNYQLILSYTSIFCLILITVFSDRMISVLLLTTTFVYALLIRNRYLVLVTLSFLVLFIAYLINFDDVSVFSMKSDLIQTLVSPTYDLNSYSITNILTLFASLYGILLPFFIYGYLKNRSEFMLLKVPTTIALVCSFSWVIVPNYEYLVPERWVIVSGIFVSIFAVYGFSLMNASIKSKQIKMIIFAVFFSFFIIYGLFFAIAPYGTIVTIPGYFHDLTQFIMPISMSMNSLDINQNKDLVHVIEWINENTAGNSIVIGSIHWRGWFSLFLDPTNDFKYEESILNISNFKNNSLFKTHGPGLCNSKTSSQDSRWPHIILVSSSEKAFENVSIFQVYGSGQFKVYNISKILCKYQ